MEQKDRYTNGMYRMGWNEVGWDEMREFRNRLKNSKSKNLACYKDILNQ